MTNHLYVQYEAEVAEGLESIGEQEIRNIPNTQNIVSGKGNIQFHYDGNLEKFLTLQTISSVYLLLNYDVPRPKALLGHQHFHRLVEAIRFIRSESDHVFQSLYFSMAGEDSTIMQRLKSEISQHTNLKLVDEGDLLIRIRRTSSGWDVLIRTTPRPLASRNWRICDYEGALNAPTAHAMAIIADLKPGERYLNIACGSGTLLIETVYHYQLQTAIGIDIDSQALECARQNIQQAALENQITLLCGDASSLPFGNDSIDVVHADLPFGQLVGSHEHNLKLYPKILENVYRILNENGRFIVITHEIRLMEMLLENSRLWQNEHTIRVSLRGLHPKIYVLRKQQ